MRLPPDSAERSLGIRLEPIRGGEQGRESDALADVGRRDGAREPLGRWTGANHQDGGEAGVAPRRVRTGRLAVVSDELGP
jgi:hypothetical protein